MLECMLLALVLVLSTVVQPAPAPAPLPERTIVFDSVCFGEGLTSRCAIPAAFFELCMTLRAAGYRERVDLTSATATK